MDVTTLELPFGRSTVSVDAPTENILGVYTPQANGEVVDEDVLLREALEKPVCSPRLRDLVRPGQKIVIVTSDLTRPCPSERLLPLILDELAASGISDADVTVVIALGLHRPMAESELEATVGPDVYRRVAVINHDLRDIVRLGVTAAGTPVEIFRPVVESDVRICLGNVELHYFVGYSGGAKAILPGCASEATITANHAMMVRSEASAGRLEGNPVRGDIEEGVAMVGVDFILNVVLDGHHCIIGAVAGDVIVAHRRGCEIAAQRSTVTIPKQADIVLVGAGGYPSDVNLYQAQKALDNAQYSVRDGGLIILSAECSEGFGNQTFEAWMTSANSPEDVLGRIQQEFVIGGHKAAAIAAVLRRTTVYLVSAISPDSVRDCGLVPFSDLREAMQAAFDEVGQGADIIVMPNGGSILPVIG